MILLKVAAAKNVWLAITGFLIMDSNFKVVKFQMVAIIWNLSCHHVKY